MAVSQLMRMPLLLWAFLWTLAAPLAAAPDIGAPTSTSGDYTESTEDLRVKVQGGFVTIERTWTDGAWYINRRWDPLAIVRDPIGNNIKYIERNGDRFEPASNDPDLFRFGKRRIIEKTDTGYRWSDRDGTWIEYDDSARSVRYGDRNDAWVAITYDGNGRRSGVFDHRGEQILWYDYDDQDRLIRIRDYSGRQVEYGYGGGAQITTVTDVRGNTWTYGYSADLLTSKTDAEDRTAALSYDEQKRLIKIEDDLGTWREYLYDYDKTREEYLFRVTDSTGMQMDNWYDRDGSLVRKEINGETIEQFGKEGDWHLVTDYAGFETRYRYDNQDNLAEIVHPDGTSVTFDFDPRLSVQTGMTDENGVVTRYEYDTRGNRTRRIEAVGSPLERTTEYDYDSYGNLLSERRLGDGVTTEAVTVYTYDVRGNRETETDPEQQVTSFEHDVMGNVLVRHDARGQDWIDTYDAAGNRITRTNPLDQTETLVYDKVGNLIRQVDRNARATVYAYDARNNRTTTIAPLDNATSTDYDGEGRPVRMTDAAGGITSMDYDGFGRMSLLLDPAGNRTEFTYAAAGEGVSFQAAKRALYPGYTEVYSYDRRGRRNQVAKTPVGSSEALVTVTGYDRAGNNVRETDAAGRTRTAAYDALNRVVSITEATGHSQSFGYDNRDNLLGIENARGIAIRGYVYDRNDLLTQETWPGGGTRVFDHDPAGNLIEIVDAKGQVTRHEHDPAGQLIATRLYPDEGSVDPAQTIHYGYDPAGNRVAWDDGTVSAVIAYDANNRKTSEQVNFGPFQAGYQVEYGADGKKSAIVYPDGARVQFSYDAAGQLTRVEIPEVGNIGFAAYERGKPTLVRYPGGTVRNLSYDGLDRVVGIEVEDVAAQLLMQHGYDYNAAGNLVGKSTEHGEYSFQYDLLDRLTEADNPTLPDEVYGYDPVGNRISSAEHPVWTYDDADRLLNDGNKDYIYDANGNLIRMEQGGTALESYAYDLQDRLSEVRDGQGSIIASYGYDPLGRRVRAETGTVIYYLYSDEGLIAELDEAGNLVRRHGWQPDGIWGSDPLWAQTANGTTFSLNDQLGTPWKQIGVSGAFQWEARYQAFGEAQVVRGDAMDNPWRLPGQYLVPELGIHYNYRRHYDPATGRYQRFDPLGVRASVNTYVYGFNNPLVNTDPYGLFCGSGTGYSGGFCAGLVIGIGTSVCYEGKCCNNQCGSYCCEYVKICACVGKQLGGSFGASGAVGNCNVSVSFPAGVGACCGPCCVSASATEAGGLSVVCCSCREIGKTCT